MPDKQEIPELKHLQPGQYISWVRKAEDPEWDEEDRPRSKPEKAAASLALELRDAFERISSLAHQLSQEKERNATARAGESFQSGILWSAYQAAGRKDLTFSGWLNWIVQENARLTDMNAGLTKMHTDLQNGEEMYIAMRDRCARSEAECERLGKAVSDEEWSNVYGYEANNEDYISQESVDALLAARRTQERGNDGE